MQKKTISLSNLEDLKIFMSPVRQNILRTMHIQGEPLTAKDIAVLTGISPSSAKHHLGRLEGLGLVRLSHTKQINGINARYYTFTDITVSIGSLYKDGLKSERRAIIEKLMRDTLDGLYRLTELDLPEEEQRSCGDFLNGVVHLTPADSKKLMKLIGDFIDTHEKKSEGTKAWEYSLAFYNADCPGISELKNTGKGAAE